MASFALLVKVLLVKVLLELRERKMPLLPLPVAFAKLLRIWLLFVNAKKIACALLTVEFPCITLQS